MKLRLAFIMAGCVAVLAGCGGGGGGDRDPVGEETTVPESALRSTEALAAWILSQRSSESKDPLALSSTMPPLSDTTEPIEVD
jgi:hypothetical protein